MGLPVVASPHGGHKQYIQHERNGLIFPLNEPDSLKNWETGLRALFQVPDLARTMGGVLRQEHRELLGARKTAKAFLDIYRSSFLAA